MEFTGFQREKDKDRVNERKRQIYKDAKVERLKKRARNRERQSNIQK